MAAINFGYTISKPRAIDLDRNNLRKSDEILREMPELQTCIGCGACTAVCTAGNLTEFNFTRNTSYNNRVVAEFFRLKAYIIKKLFIVTIRSHLTAGKIYYNRFDKHL